MYTARVKITGTLLIISFIVSMFTIVTSVHAYAHIIRVPEDYPTIQEAINAASDGDTIMVGPGEWYGGIVDKPLKIRGKRGAVIVDGEPYPGPGLPTPIPPQPYHFGFFIKPEGSGSTISRFTFRCERIGGTGDYLWGPIFARRGTDNVVVTNNKIYIANIPQCQCITNWDGNNWVIRNNDIITDGSIDSFTGILIASAEYLARGAKDNIVASNTIIVDTMVGGGIYLHVRVDITAGEVTNNRVLFNKVVVTGPETAAIEFWALYFGEGPMPGEVLYDNVVMFNDLRGSTSPLVFNPPELEQANTIAWNRL